MKCKIPLCPLTQALSVMGGKWKPQIIYQLKGSKKRFGQLHAIMEVVSKKVLTNQLKELVEDGLVYRTSYAELPPRVEYELTDKGRELIPIFQAIGDWGQYLVDDYRQSLQKVG